MRNIYIEPDEEIVSVIDRLVETEDKQVNLVVPRGAQIWQSSINLKLLKREVDNLAKEVTLLVSDELGLEMAEKIGFVVKKEGNQPVELVQEDKEDKEDKEDMINLLVEELRPQEKQEEKTEDESRKKMMDIITPEEEKPVKFKFPRRKKKPILQIVPSQPLVSQPIEVKRARRSRWPKFFIIFIVLAFVVALAVGYLALPTTEVTISPKTEKVSFDLMVIGSKDIAQIDESLNKIPLQEVEVKKTKSREFLATGEKQLDEKARGFITIYNEYSSSPQTLVATTRFESPDGKIFRIMKNITVPGAEIIEGKIVPKTIEVEVVADQVGADYNIGPTNFTIPGFKGGPKYAGFYGQSKTSMTGGSTEKVKVVTAEDFKKAEESLAEELKNEVKQALQEQIPTDLKITQGGLEEEITEVSSTAQEDDRVDKFTLEITALVRALLYKEEDLKNLVDLNLIAQTSEDKQPLSETQQINWQETLIDWQKGEASFSLSIEEEIAWQIDVETIKKDLTGQDEVEVRKYLANQLAIEKAKVTFWPFWVKRVPYQEKKIKITID